LILILVSYIRIYIRLVILISVCTGIIEEILILKILTIPI
jgi:hypothetical protein